MVAYEDIKVGDEAEIEHTVTRKDLDQFVELTGDNNRLHIDPDFAARTSFKKPVVHGMLGAAFISTVIGTKLPGEGALWFSQSLEFLLPVRVGDRLSVRAKVLRKNDHMKTIDLQTDIFNQHRQRVTTGIAKVKMVESGSEQKAIKSALQPLAETVKRPDRRVALVIGGSGGIGSAVCRMLAADGFDIAVHYFKNSGSAQAVAKDVQARGRKEISIQADMESDNQMKAMAEQVVKQFGTISVLVSCVTAKVASLRFSELRWSDFEDHIGKTVKGLFYLTQAVVPVMEAAGYGKIILIGSQYVDAPAKNILPYVTAKAALDGFARSLALELAPKGIRVNIVSPGMTDTDLIADVPEHVRLLTAAQAPLRRLASPEDVAGAVSFLASSRADYLTGETIRVNGGQVMR